MISSGNGLFGETFWKIGVICICLGENVARIAVLSSRVQLTAPDVNTFDTPLADSLETIYDNIRRFTNSTNELNIEFCGD